MYAIIDIHSKQYKIEKGSRITVDRIDAEENTKLDFNTVVFLNDGNKPDFGRPYIPSVTVKATVVSHTKGEKIQVRTYKRRKDYHRYYGHRSAYTVLRITDIVGAS